MARLRARIRPEGPVVDVAIGPSQAALASGKLDDPRTVVVPALFDTGADVTVMHAGIAERIGIFPHDRAPVAGLHDTATTCNVFDVNLGFPDAGIQLRDVTVVESRVMAAPRIQVLIGRSVLWKGVLHYNGLEHTFSFEIPDEPR